MPPPGPKREAVVVVIGALLALPFLLIVLATEAVPLDGRLALSAWCVRTFLSCLVLAPALSFAVVANVFLFVNLRYSTRD